MIRDFKLKAWLAALLVAAVMLPAACNRSPAKLPSTYPVRGKVIFRGGKPAFPASVFFQSLSDAHVSASGEVAADGSFQLRSFIAGDRAPGAIAGRHRVMVLSLTLGGQEGYFPPKVFAEPLTVAPGDNDFTLIVEADTATNVKMEHH
jgi:hypothetical protein